MVKVRTLFQWIEDKELVLPEFQRDFVWKASDVKKFIQSIYNKYPTGTLLIWKTKTPPKLRGENKPLETVYTKILLDGQQRLTTLYTLIKGKAPPYYGDKSLFFNIHFNVETEEFVYYQPSKMKGKKEWISLNQFFEPGSATSFIRNSEHKDYYFDHLDQLDKLEKVKEYDYYVDEDKLSPALELEKVVEIFNLVNKEGRTLQESDLALAHVSVFWPEFKELCREKLQELRGRGCEFHLDFMILCLNAIATGHAKFQYIYDIPDEVLRESWGKLKESLDYLINVLQTRAYITSTDPYELKTDALLVPLIVYLAHNDFEFENERILNKFLYWLYNAMMWARYTRRGKSAPLEQDVVAVVKGRRPEVLIDNLRREVRDFVVKQEDLDGTPISSPLFNMAYIVANARGAVDWFRGVKLQSDLVGGSNKLNKHHIFPQALLRERGYYKDRDKQKMVNEIANRAFLTEKVNRKISDQEPSTYFEEVIRKYPTALEKQFIPMNKQLWKLDNYEDFLRKRRQIIADEINKFVNLLVSEEEVRPNIAELIKQEESYNLEFKSSFLWNFKENKVDKRMKFSVLKSILGFMNSNGGTLIIGVDDNHRILGLGHDYKANWKGNKDGFLLELRDYIQNNIGINDYKQCVNIDFAQIEGKEICVIQADKSLDPKFIKKDGRKILFVRLDNGTKPLGDPEEINAYIKQNWK